MKRPLKSGREMIGSSGGSLPLARNLREAPFAVPLVLLRLCFARGGP